MIYPFLLKNLGEIIDYQTGEHWSKEELQSRIAAKVSFFFSQDMQPEELVLIVHGNNAHFFADILALWQFNVCCICVDSDIGLTEFENIVDFCKVRFAICYDGIPKKLVELAQRIKFIDTLKIPAGKNILDCANTHDFPSRLAKPALMLFTSGTTGSPKGVVHSFRTLIAKWTILPQYVPLELLNVSLCLLPTHFGHGLICNCLYPLLNGKKLIILPKFNLSLLMRLGNIIDDFEVTYMSSVPALWRLAMHISRPPAKKTLRLITCGSAPLSAILWTQIQQWSGTKRVWNTYGITETGSWIAGTSMDEPTPKDGFIGRGWGSRILVTKQKDARIRDSELQPLGPGETGYIWIQTPYLMEGYWNQPELTASVISGSWFYTGDLGYLTEEGFLLLSGRERDEINYGGIKVVPDDVDFILSRHEAILECCTFGMDDEIAGKIVGVVIVFKDNAIKLTSAALKEWLRKRISDYKVPTRWFEADEIPKNARGKFSRLELPTYYKNRQGME